MSYIYRIQVNDKYLLVKNSKWNYYQPVGGVYKILSEDIGFLKALDKKFCKKYFSKNEQIKMTALRINPQCFKLAVKAFSKN